MAGIVLVNPSVVTLRKDAKFLLPVLRVVLPAYPGSSATSPSRGCIEPGYRYMPGEGDVLAVAGLAGRCAPTSRG